VDVPEDRVAREAEVSEPDPEVDRVVGTAAVPAAARAEDPVDPEVARVAEVAQVSVGAAPTSAGPVGVVAISRSSSRPN
jgi:hypothetical protein